MSTALLVMHVNIAPYRLTVLPFCLTVKGPNMPTPERVNDAATFDLQAGRFAIFCSPTLPLNFRHSAQLETTFFTAPIITNYSTNYPVYSFSYFIQSEPTSSMSSLAIAILKVGLSPCKYIHIYLLQ